GAFRIAMVALPVILRSKNGWRYSRPRRMGQQDAVSRGRSGYTSGMKTAVSLPDDVFDQAERLARRLRKSRSALYREAIAEYVARHEPEALPAKRDGGRGRPGDPALE